MSEVAGKMDFLPICMDLRGRRALVVGGGEVATRKIDMLRQAGAGVVVVSPALSPALSHQAHSGAISYRQGSFAVADLDGVVLVIAATNDAAVNRQVSELAQARSLPVNVVDNPALCTFVMPSIIDRSPVQIAVSTGGASPVLARLLRARLEASIPAAYGRLAAMVETFRGTVKRRFDTVNARRNFWESVLQGRIAELVFAGQEAEARTELEQAIQAGGMEDVGEVYLVGGGPVIPICLPFAPCV